MKWNKGKLVIYGVIAYTLVTFVQQQVTINRLNREHQDMHKKIEMAKKENERLQKEIKYSKTMDFIKKIASDELGLVKKGQTVYIDINNK